MTADNKANVVVGPGGSQPESIFDEQSVGDNGKPGRFSVRDSQGHTSMFLTGARQVKPPLGPIVEVDPSILHVNGDIFTANALGKATIHLAGADGTVQMFDKSGVPTVFVNGATGELFLGGQDDAHHGLIELRSAGFKSSIRLEAAGGHEQNAMITCTNKGGGKTLQIDGGAGKINASNIALTGDVSAANIALTGGMNASNINLAGDMNASNINLTGDLVLQNADCAEEFDIAADATEIEPGTVMVVGEDGTLRPSEEAFDRCVAGVISGAGDYKPGIVLDRQYSSGRRLPIALVGKVFCKVDADHGAIRVGDLLTTSPTPGHAMKAGDPLKGFGAVLGKALRSLEAGQGLIPVLVALQ